jgi:CRP-like cAMP-binding protein
MQGDPADSVFFLQCGRVKLAVTSQQGKEAIVAVLEPGGFFGEGCGLTVHSGLLSVVLHDE